MRIVDERELQNHLQNCSKAKLVSLLLQLSKRDPSAKRFLVSKLVPSAAVPNFDQYKAQVRAEFFPGGDYPGDGNPSIAYRLLQQVEVEATHSYQVIDFLYFCVETGVEFTNTYGDIDEEFYIAFETLYERAASLALEDGLLDDYSDRACNIFEQTSGLGWGFHDELDRIFTDYLSKFDKS